MRSIAFRRHQTRRHMNRRLKEDRNQHYDDLKCPCWTDPRAIARFKEQPGRCGNRCWGCNYEKLAKVPTRQDLRADTVKSADDS